jgi:hypothetical protein
MHWGQGCRCLMSPALFLPAQVGPHLPGPRLSPASPGGLRQLCGALRFSCHLPADQQVFIQLNSGVGDTKMKIVTCPCEQFTPQGLVTTAVLTIATKTKRLSFSSRPKWTSER